MTNFRQGPWLYLKKHCDLVLLSLCLIATAFGMLLIYSATGYMSAGTQLRRVLIQGAGTVIGVGLYFAFSLIEINRYLEKWWWLLAFNLLFIALLIPFGVDDGTGNKSWIYASWMPTSIQPAEIVKLSYTVLLAKQLAWFRENGGMGGIRPLVWTAGQAMLMFGWIFVISGDAGSGLVYLMIFVGMGFVAGLAWYWFALAMGIGGVGILALVILDKIPGYMIDRFIVIFDHSYDSLGKGWQQTRSLMAIGSGRLFGQGLFQGIQTQSAFSDSLPARHTDLIFSVCGEELGLLGCVLVLLCEFSIVFRCFQTARMAKTTMDSLICVGFGTMLMFQTVENVGMCLFVMPVIGLTLPFFSYGGSSIVTLYAAMGIVSGVRGRTLPNWLRKT